MTFSFTSGITVDDEPMKEVAVKVQPTSAVWFEANIDDEWLRDQEHERWWKNVLAKRRFGTAVIKGASRVDATAAAARSSQDKDAARRKATEELELAAALYREIGKRHEELFPILGYGVEGSKFVVVQAAALESKGLRSFTFGENRCYRVLGQTLKGLRHLHEQLAFHGQLSPESIVIDEGCMGPQARLMWNPGQKRMEGHANAMLGFRAPGMLGGASDVWGLACVMLVWWTGFNPSPHPWTQFARSPKLQHDINEALAKEPQDLPQAVLELHAAAAGAEEPLHSFLSLFASLIIECLAWDPAERPTTAQLLQHRFFDQTH